MLLLQYLSIKKLFSYFKKGAFFDVKILSIFITLRQISIYDQLLNYYSREYLYNHDVLNLM